MVKCSRESFPNIKEEHLEEHNIEFGLCPEGGEESNFKIGGENRQKNFKNVVFVLTKC